MIKILITSIFLLVQLVTVCYGAQVNPAYFRALARIEKTASDEQLMKPVTPSQQQLFMHLYNSSHREPLKLSGEVLTTVYGDSAELVRGDLNNDGEAEYVLIITGGSMRTNVVTVYKLHNAKLEDLRLDQALIRSLPHLHSASQFYLHTANPFLVKKNGVTLMRFMSVPFQSYDASQLKLCTYLWKNNKVRLVGPNLTFTKVGKLIQTQQCIG